MKTVAEIGEFGLIQRIQSILDNEDIDVLIGLGDDAATFIPRDKPIIVSTDAMVQDVHFNLDWASPENLAHKALASSLSDLAAKAAIPAQTVITIGLPGSTPVEWIESFYQSLAEKSNLWQTTIIGGDTVSSDKLWFSLTVWGYQSTPDPIQINNAKPGDQILVSGTLGDAAGGLELLKQKNQLNSSETKYLIERFSCPNPRLEEALRITSISTPTTMTDISDGISRDLRKICSASSVGAKLKAQNFPISTWLNNEYGEKARDFAWKGGEDYELLLTIAKKDTEKLLYQWDQSFCPLTIIGEITLDRNKIIVEGLNNELKPGFDHFNKTK